jgi:hypothetical protein
LLVRVVEAIRDAGADPGSEVEPQWKRPSGACVPDVEERASEQEFHRDEVLLPGNAVFERARDVRMI